MSVNQTKPAQTLEQRKELGRSLREVLHRVDQAHWSPSPARRSPIEVIQSTCQTRLPELIPIRFGRMAESPFRFFRGAAALMAADLAPAPTTGLKAQICGDAHVLNLSAFAAPDGHLVFDIYDFDETYPGPFEWDIKRLATSLVLAGKNSGDDSKNAEQAVLTFVESYRNTLADLAEMTMIEVARFEPRRRTKSVAIRAILGKAERMTAQLLMQRLTRINENGELQFNEIPNKIFHVEPELQKEVLAAVAHYRNTLPPERQLIFDSYRPVDVAFRLGGIGSVGTRVYVVLCIGKDLSDPLFLQFKEEELSCLAQYFPEVPPFEHQGRRVVEGQRKMQTVGDPFLGWTNIQGRDFMVRQLKDHKASVDLAELKGEALLEFAHVCGRIFAKAHARSGDAAALSGYCGDNDKLDKAIALFAASYAAQTEKDHGELLKAIKEGTVVARLGV